MGQICCSNVSSRTPFRQREWIFTLKNATNLPCVNIPEARKQMPVIKLYRTIPDCGGSADGSATSRCILGIPTNIKAPSSAHHFINPLLIYNTDINQNSLQKTKLVTKLPGTISGLNFFLAQSIKINDKHNFTV